MSEPTQIVLDADAVEQLAQRIADLVAEQLHAPRPVTPAPHSAELLTAAQVSDWWGVDRSWVYDHAEQLGVIKLGTGTRPRLRFDPEIVAAALRLPPRPPDPETGPVSESTAIPRGRTPTVPIQPKQSYGR